MFIIWDTKVVVIAASGVECYAASVQCVVFYGHVLHLVLGSYHSTMFIRYWYTHSPICSPAMLLCCCVSNVILAVLSFRHSNLL